MTIGPRIYYRVASNVELDPCLQLRGSAGQRPQGQNNTFQDIKNHMKVNKIFTKSKLAERPRKAAEELEIHVNLWKSVKIRGWHTPQDGRQPTGKSPTDENAMST